MLLGEAYDALDRHKEAITEFQTACRKVYYPNAHFAAGYLLWKDRQYDAAATEFEQELASDPRHSQAMAYLGDIRLKQSRPDAESLLRRSIQLRNDIRVAHFDLGVIESKRKNYAKAVQEFEKAVALDPDQADAHYRLARVYLATGRKAEGEAQLQLVKQLHEDRNKDLILKITGPQGKPRQANRSNRWVHLPAPARDDQRRPVYVSKEFARAFCRPLLQARVRPRADPQYDRAVLQPAF